MLDLETMGTGPEAALVAIGAVAFDAQKGELGFRFYSPVDLVSSVAAGMRMDPQAVLWWLRQGDQARADICTLPGPFDETLDAFAQWCAGLCPRGELRLWGNGADFDNVILASAYRLAGLEAPWRYFNNRCYRTLKALRPDVPFAREGTHHNALDDAFSQARHAMAILRVMGTDA